MTEPGKSAAPKKVAFLAIRSPAPCGVNAGNCSIRRGPAQTGEGKEPIAPLRGKERPRRLLPPGHEVIEGSFQLSVGREEVVRGHAEHFTQDSEFEVIDGSYLGFDLGNGHSIKRYGARPIEGVPPTDPESAPSSFVGLEPAARHSCGIVSP